PLHQLRRREARANAAHGVDEIGLRLVADRRRSIERGAAIDASARQRGERLEAAARLGYRLIEVAAEADIGLDLRDLAAHRRFMHAHRETAILARRGGRGQAYERAAPAAVAGIPAKLLTDTCAVGAVACRIA